VTSTIGETASGTSDPAVIACSERAVIPVREWLFGQPLRMTRNCVDAEDLVQASMVKAYATARTSHRTRAS
jgi:DNA-directed RNA polymerase specialized sigma24 family protein